MQAAAVDTGTVGAQEPISGQFVALLGILVLAPLPLGSNRPWALALLGVSIALLLAWHLWAPDAAIVCRDECRDGRAPWQRAALPLQLMSAWVALLALQLVPLPSQWAVALDFDRVDGFPLIAGDWTTISVDPYSTRLYLFKALTLLAFLWLLLRLTATQSRVELLAKTIVLCGFLQALTGVVLFAWGANYSLFFVQVEHLAAQGTFLNRNHFAGYLELALAVGIGLMIAKLDDRRARTWKRWLRDWLALLVSEKARLRIMLIVMVVGLIASRSRMGNAAFFVSLMIAGTVAIVLSRQAARSTVIFIASLVVLDIVLVGGVVGVEQVLQRIEDTHWRNREPVTAQSNAGGPQPRTPAAASVATGRGAQRSTSASREESLEIRTEAGRRAAVAILRGFPLLGTGGGSFHVAFVAFRPPEFRNYFFDHFLDHAHNDFVEFAVETGLIGAGLLAAIVLTSLFQAIRILVVRRNRLARGMAFAALMGIVALMIHSFVDFNLQIPANAMIFIVILALPYLVGSYRSGGLPARRGDGIISRKLVA